ncbi:MAG: hypothetical protein K1W30_17655 [Lachnospiraceae bacterium]
MAADVLKGKWGVGRERKAGLFYAPGTHRQYVS